MITGTRSDDVRAPTSGDGARTPVESEEGFQPMHSTHIVGVDPGLVHTGLVRLGFERPQRRITVEHQALSGADVAGAAAWLDHPRFATPIVFIEGYRPRSHMNTDAEMSKAVTEFRRELGGQVLLNTGIKKVVCRPLLEPVGGWCL